jgi:hypothetical protein
LDSFLGKDSSETAKPKVENIFSKKKEETKQLEFKLDDEAG